MESRLKFAITIILGESLKFDCVGRYKEVLGIKRCN